MAGGGHLDRPRLAVVPRKGKDPPHLTEGGREGGKEVAVADVDRAREGKMCHDHAALCRPNRFSSSPGETDETRPHSAQNGPN